MPHHFNTTLKAWLYFSIVCGIMAGIIFRNYFFNATNSCVMLATQVILVITFIMPENNATDASNSTTAAGITKYCKSYQLINSAFKSLMQALKF